MIKLRYPVDYISITQTYKTGHQAMDFGWNRNYGGKNQKIYAPYDGTVIDIVNGKDNNLTNRLNAGNLITIKHADNIKTRLIHLEKNSIKVKKGDKVKTGEHIANMGNSGYALGEHLHYDVYINDKKVYPIKYTYVYPKQTVSEITKKEFGKALLYYSETSLDELAREVIQGKWGNGDERKDKLTKAGYDYYKVQMRVNEMLNSKYNLTKMLSRGSSGSEVRQLQNRLNELGAKLVIDGIFGSKTRQAVINIQKKNKITQDGIVGPVTAKALGWLYKGN